MNKRLCEQPNAEYRTEIAIPPMADRSHGALCREVYNFSIKSNYLRVCLDLKCNRDFARTAFQFTDRFSCG